MKEIQHDKFKGSESDSYIEETDSDFGPPVDDLIWDAWSRSGIKEENDLPKKAQGETTSTDDADAGPGAVGEGWEKVNEQTPVRKDLERIK